MLGLAINLQLCTARNRCTLVRIAQSKSSTGTPGRSLGRNAAPSIPSSQSAGGYPPLGVELSVVRGKMSRGRRRSEEHTSELQSIMRSSYAVFCLKKKQTQYI